MARPKEFDRDAVLERAMQTFCEKGYESTSVRDLVGRMGIGRASLYDTFGSKHEIFAEALERYTAKQEDKLLAPLRHGGSARRALAEFFRGLVEQGAAGEPSCLATKSALVTCRGDRETAARVNAFATRVEDALHAVLLRGRAAGEVAGGRNLRAVARHLTNSMFGLAVIATIRRDRRVLQDIVRTSLSVLD